jgi:hypothetical protein
MTQSSDNRLDRLEALLATTIEGLARTEANLGRTEKITESNARAIEAWSSRIEDGIAEAEEVTSAMAANTRQQVEADRVRFDALHEEHTQRFNTLLEEARADRARADRDRAINESEHRAFRETFQTLLAEIARLWQRVAG